MVPPPTSPSESVEFDESNASDEIHILPQIHILPEHYVPNKKAGRWMGFPVCDVSGPIIQVLRAKFEASLEAEIVGVRFYTYLR